MTKKKKKKEHLEFDPRVGAPVGSKLFPYPSLRFHDKSTMMKVILAERYAVRAASYIISHELETTFARYIGWATSPAKKIVLDCQPEHWQVITAFVAFWKKALEDDKYIEKQRELPSNSPKRVLPRRQLLKQPTVTEQALLPEQAQEKRKLKILKMRQHHVKAREENEDDEL